MEVNIEDLTLGQIKQIKAACGVTKKPKANKSIGEIKIVILQRGWVAVGRYYEDGNECYLTDCATIRLWGTTKGLGEIAKNGPTDKTVLDWSPTIRFHKMVVVCTIDCEGKKWELKSSL